MQQNRGVFAIEEHDRSCALGHGFANDKYTFRFQPLEVAELLVAIGICGSIVLTIDLLREFQARRAAVPVMLRPVWLF
jgi:hypothetical protein